MLLAVVLATVALLGAGSSANAEHRARPTDPFTFGNPAFCTPEGPVEDFGLSQLPPVLEVPSSGDLPFGPKTVSLDLSGGPILPIGESFGFWLFSGNYSGHTPLHWILRNRIRPVDPSGETGGVAAKSRVRVRTISASDEVKLFLLPPRKPGFYRYDIEIADFDGQSIATYSKYLRVERTFWKARLGLNRQVFNPGQQVLSRVENLGTETVWFGEEFSIQKEENGQWTHVKDPTRGIRLSWLGAAGAGMAGRCNALRLPRDFPAGHYRIVKEVDSSPRPSGNRSYRLSAAFEVALPTTDN